MNKQEVQQRVLQNGKPLNLKKFTWCENTNTFSSNENNLIIDFARADAVNLIAGNYSTQKAGNYSTQTAGYESTQTAGDSSTQKAGNRSTQTAGDSSTQKAGNRSTQTAGSESTQTAGFESTQKAGFKSTQKAGHWSTQKAGSESTQKASHWSTQEAGHSSTQKAGCESTQKAGCESTHYIDSNSQVTTGYCSTIYAQGDNIVIINRNVFEVIVANKGDIIQIAPKDIKGHIKNGIYSETGKKAIIADGILSEVVSKKGEINKVINYGESKASYLIEKEINDKKVYSHGKTIKEARDAIIYKLANRDTSKYKDLTLDSILSREEAIQCYMTITGACSSGTKYFVDRLKDDRKKLSIRDIVKLTEGQYGNETFYRFFEK